MSCERLLRPEVGGRGVADALGVGGEQRVDVVGRGHPDGIEVGELAGVAPDLVRRVDPETGELELGVADDAAQRVVAHVAGAPLDDACRHGGAPYPSGSAGQGARGSSDPSPSQSRRTSWSTTSSRVNVRRSTHQSPARWTMPTMRVGPELGRRVVDPDVAEARAEDHRDVAGHLRGEADDRLRRVAGQARR